MKTKRMTLMTMLAALVLLLAACGGAASDTAVVEPAAQTAVEETSDDAMMAESDDAIMDESDDAMMDEGEGHNDDAMMDESDDEMMAEGEGHDDDAMMDESDDEMMAEGEGHNDDAMMDDDAMMEEGAGEIVGDDMMAAGPAWMSLPLVNAATGESFTLGSFAGQTVFVEPMATWCSNCRQQLNNVSQAKAQLGDDVVFVALSLETTLDPAQLARYQQDNGFDWTFAVMSDEILKGLADEFGRSITSAPSTPHFIISPDGSFSELSTGIDQPDELIALIQAAS